MPGVEQQANFITGIRHQIIHIFSRFNHRSHVVVIGNLYPLLLGVARKLGEFFTVLLPALLREARTQMYRRLLLAVNAATDFGKDQHLRSQFAQ